MESHDGDDTAFYAEITRHILMLMDDDNSETHARAISIKDGSKFGRRLVSYGGSGGKIVATGDYFSSWSESGRRFEVPVWMERLWASNAAAGTGVFIPRAEAVAGKSRRRRRNKPRKNNFNDGGRMHSSVGLRIHG